MHKLALFESEVQMLREANEGGPKKHVYEKEDRLANKKHKICKRR